MGSRKPAAANRFYPESVSGCLEEVKECLSAVPTGKKLPDRIVGGIVPHAGWLFSGDLAGMVFSAIKTINGKVDTFIIFGAAHRYLGRKAVVYDKGSWQTPLGQIDIDEELAEIIAKESNVVSDPDAHRTEHSIEVQVPFIQHLFPEAKIVPIIVPSAEFDLELGSDIAKIISETKDKEIVCIASTDLTHYGPGYGFTPAGIGPAGIDWAKETNDKEFIDLALKMKPHELLETAVENGSACGPGATAALVATAGELGRTEGVLLGHTHSNEVMKRKLGRSSEDSVGYAAIVY
jgi:AmmeMemoRadiSam system protein B